MKKYILSLCLGLIFSSPMTMAQNRTDLELEIRETINEQCIHKVKAFTNHLAKIATKVEADSIKAYHIEACMDLFVGRGGDTKDSDGNIIIPAPRIEVSSATTGKMNSYFIRNYLERLKNLEYTKLIFKTSKCYLAEGGIRKIDTNQYAATVSFYQVFVGYKGELEVYRDKTQKTVNVIIKRDDLGRFEVLLGDIKVDQTSSGY